MGTEIKKIDAVDGEYEVDIQSNRFTSISFGGGHGGSATAGTIAITGWVPGATVFEAITGISSIDISAPITQVIKDTPVSKLKFSLSGFAGTANEVKIAVNTYDFRV